eukprot:6173117-Pleurochrysis_carterae.AAC.1
MKVEEQSGGHSGECHLPRSKSKVTLTAHCAAVRERKAARKAAERKGSTPKPKALSCAVRTDGSASEKARVGASGRVRAGLGGSGR